MVTPCNRPIRKTLRLFSFLVFLLNFNVSNVFSQDAAKLFKQNCASCHKLTSQKLTGPGLLGVADRVPKPTDEWLFKWIKNAPKVIKSGDAYAQKIFIENNKAVMTAFEGVLTDDEIKTLITFVKNPPAEAPVTVGQTAGETSASAQGDNGSGSGVSPFYLAIIVIIVLLLMVVILKSVKRNLQNATNAKKGLPEVEDVPLDIWMQRNKRTVALIIIVLVLLGLRWSWYTLKDVGVYTGYKPDQPIKFSHKIHAGDNAINCEYCHSGVSKSRVASVPSASVCMNCHKGIQQGPTTGTAEIAKIYAAVGWNPEKQIYDKPQKPLVWNKVHVLPDFVFFSHQQHVVVGKQECKTCHGEVEKIDVAQQVSPLTMAWCIDCHRQTEVPGMKDNLYYTELHKKLAEKFRGKPDSVITVAKMGGIECSKCHY